MMLGLMFWAPGYALPPEPSKLWPFLTLLFTHLPRDGEARYPSGWGSTLLRKGAEYMPQTRRAEEPDELLEKATTMLSYCKSVLGERAGPEHFVLVAAAANTFGGMDAEEAARFLKDNWDLLDERAGVRGIGRGHRLEGSD